MDIILQSLFSGPIADRIPGWVITFVIIAFALKQLGLLERWARALSIIGEFISDREALEAERQKFEDQREAELERVQVEARLQADASRQLANQKAQQQLYDVLEQSIEYLRSELNAKLNNLTERSSHMHQELEDVKHALAQSTTAMQISHQRIDVLAGIVPKIADNFDELKPHLVSISKNNQQMQTVMQDLEGAIRLLVEQQKAMVYGTTESGE